MEYPTTYQPGDRVEIIDGNAAPAGTTGTVEAIDPTRPYGMHYAVRLDAGQLTNYSAWELAAERSPA